jgi:KTSC domain-containing protein
MPAAKSTGNKWIPVESEMLEYVRYDEKARHFDAIFHTGEKYRYFNVPAFEFEGLMSAESIGRYMHKRILNNRRYNYERLD